jgi:hypothetical protein
VGVHRRLGGEHRVAEVDGGAQLAGGGQVGKAAGRREVQACISRVKLAA